MRVQQQAKAKQWGEWLAVHRTSSQWFEGEGRAKRLTNFKHEVETVGMSLMQIEQLAECTQGYTTY